MRGKYSPTVSAAYQKDQSWWTKYSGADKPTDDYVQYDPDGYDAYGYDAKDVDRAGNSEHIYYCDDNDYGDNYAYNDALDAWGFDGTKPTLQEQPVASEYHKMVISHAEAAGINPAVAELMVQAGYVAPHLAGRAAELVKLVIQQCCNIAAHQHHAWEVSAKIKEHFGVK